MYIGAMWCILEEEWQYFLLFVSLMNDFILKCNKT